MIIALARIDDRLIHGQVVTAWLQAIGKCDEILICDDKARTDELLRQVLRAAAPPGIAVRVLSIDETIAEFNHKADDPRRVLLLARSPEPMLRLIENGLAINHINLGGMGAGPGRRHVYRSVSLSEEDMNSLRRIQEKGVTVDLRMVPSDRGIDLAAISDPIR